MSSSVPVIKEIFVEGFEVDNRLAYSVTLFSESVQYIKLVHLNNSVSIVIVVQTIQNEHKC